jgi:acyl dehydratase
MSVMTDPTIQVGTTWERYTGRIDADAAVAYALATNDPNEVYVRGGAVPPLYTTSIVLPSLEGSMRQGIPAGAIAGDNGSVHGEHDAYFHHPVEPGMALQWRATTHSAKQTRAGVLVTQRILLSDMADVPLVEHYWSSVFVGGTTIPADLGPDLRDHTFPEEARTRPVGTYTFDVTRDQAFRYAGASGDHAPHAIDDEAARADGYRSKIMQGLCTFSMCTGAVVKVTADGDPGRLRRFAGRLAAPMYPRQQLTVELYDAGRTEDGGQAIAFEASSNGVVIIKHGRADLRPA